jgi:hypothetical protein
MDDRSEPQARVSRASTEAEARRFAPIDVISRQELVGHPLWASQFAKRRKDHRFYELVEDTIDQNFVYGYLRIRNGAGQEIAIQPFFKLDQDMLAGLPRGWANYVEAIRRIWPSFLLLPTLMIGCTVGEGCLAGELPEQHSAIAECFSHSLVAIARELGAHLVVLKEFPARYRTALSALRQSGFTRIPSFPNVRLPIDHANFEDFCRRHLSANMRTKLKRKFRDAAAHRPVTMELIPDIAPHLDEVYPLYIQVYEKSAFKFELLTREFLLSLGARMPDKVRFFVWRQDGKAIGFNICMIEGRSLYSEYIGLDYAVALDVHLYFIVMRDVIEWAIRNGFKFYCSTGLNYEPKHHFRFELDPLDIYVRHTSDAVNPLLRPFLSWLEPTRHDPILKRFENYPDLSNDRAF